MSNTTADLVEEALGLIEGGDLTLESGSVRYGAQWPSLRPVVETALHVQQAAQPPLVSARPFVALDKRAGWAALQSQLRTTAPLAAPSSVKIVQVAPPRPVPAVPARAAWGVTLSRLSGPRVQRFGAMALLTLFLFLGLAFAVNDAEPGDWFYRAKLGLDHVGELTSFSLNDRAQAALNYADRRLNELEKLAGAGRAEQVTEAQGQYLRGLELSLYYAGNDKFSNYAVVYSHLNDQRDRVYRLQSYTFLTGQRPLQVSNLLQHLDAGVNILAPKVPGVPPSPAP